MNDKRKPRVAYLTVGYPTLSQTFIQREVENLARNGIEITVFPCRQFGFAHEINGIPVIPLHPLFGILALGGLLRLIFKPKTLIRGILLIRKYRWNSLDNMLANFWGIIAGLAVASEIRHANAQLVHAAWAALPATAAAVAARVLDIPFSFGGHAYDIYRHGGDGFLKPKLEAAAFVHTTTRANAEYLSSISPKANIVLARRGLNMMPNVSAEPFSHDSLSILSVGRLIKKKGYFHQLSALRELLDRGINTHLKIIGDGPLLPKMNLCIADLKLSEHVTLTGSLNPIEVSMAYRDADVFWFTGIIDDEGDRDGLPNVIPEAMAHGLPVISSKSSGAMEAVEHEVTGLVADTTSAPALAEATLRLAGDRGLVSQLTLNARKWVSENFMAPKNTSIIAAAMDKFSVISK